MAKLFRCKLDVCVCPANPTLETAELFDEDYRESNTSPVDEFLIRLKPINKLAPQLNNFDPYQGQLVLLGVIAAVESYFRTLFRRLIEVDEICQETVHQQDISYGAAIHLSKEMLPEAILERITFISRRNIVGAMKDLLATKGNLPPELEVALDDFVRVCQLRHCAVHRFGKLGVRNATVLGLTDHSSLLEKPLKLNYAALQSTIAISTGLVKTINNYLFNEMLSRLPPQRWTGVYQTDKDQFGVYYKLFADKVSQKKTPPAYLFYRDFWRQRRIFEEEG